MTDSRLNLKRSQILAFRRQVGALDDRLPPGHISLRQAAWAGLQDSMPRAALLSIHARVEGTTSSTWEDPSLVQLCGPRYNVFVVAGGDLAVFSLGLFPDDAKGQRRTVDLAARLHEFLRGTRISYREAGRALGVPPNSLRYASRSGTLLIRWEGARQPTVWTVPPPWSIAATHASSWRVATSTSMDPRRPKPSALGPGSGLNMAPRRSRRSASR